MLYSCNLEHNTRNISTKYLVIVIVLVTGLIACLYFYFSSIKVPVVKIKETQDLKEIFIDRWRVIGPFSFNSVESDSSRVKISELESVFNKGALKLFSGSSRHILQNFHTNKLVSDTSGFFDIRGSLAIKDEHKIGTKTYFVSNISAESETKVYLALKGKGAYNIYINGELCMESPYTHFKNMFPQYQYFQKVTLHPGKNLVIIECTKKYENVQHAYI